MSHIGDRIGARAIKGFCQNVFPVLLHSKRNNVFAKKTLIDYGVGGGYIGEYLLRCWGLSQYYGYDVSPRSLAEADKLLSGKKYRYKLFEAGVSGSIEFVPGVDVLMCLAVIQHFPSIHYLVAFLDSVNMSGAKKVLLQIRYAPGDPVFSDTPYMGTNSVLAGCSCNFDFVSLKMPHYKCVETSRVIDANKYQYGVYDLCV